MKLIRFDYVDDDGNLHLNSKVFDVKPETQFGCGIYTFEKLNRANWMTLKLEECKHELSNVSTIGDLKWLLSQR